jgi:hypothetical protein
MKSPVMENYGSTIEKDPAKDWVNGEEFTQKEAKSEERNDKKNNGIRRKPGRPRKHNLKPVVKEGPIGFDFDKATVTTKTFTIKVDGFDPDINVWREDVRNNIQHVKHSEDVYCGCENENFQYLEPHNKGDVIDEYVFSKKNAKNAKKRDNVFKNCFTAVVLDESLKPTTIKICKKGSFQLTGCLSMESGEFCILSLMSNVWKLHPEWVPDTIEMTIKPVMTNIKFVIGYKISIVKALDFFENRKDIHGFFSYKLRVNPAINIKELLSEEDFEQVPVRNVKIYKHGGVLLGPSFCVPKRPGMERHRESNEITLTTYISKLPSRDRQKYEEEKHTTLLLFRTGSVILSGIHENLMRRAFEKFQRVTLNYRDLLE